MVGCASAVDHRRLSGSGSLGASCLTLPPHAVSLLLSFASAPKDGARRITVLYTLTIPGWRARPRSFAVAIVVATAYLLLVGPFADRASAQSSTLPPVVSDNFDAVHGQAESSGLPNGRPPVECSAVCEQLVKDERAAAPNASGRARLVDELYRWRQRAGRLLPRASTVVNRVSLVVTTFGVGVLVGTGLRKMFLSSEVPAQDAGAGDNAVYYAVRIEKGSSLPGSPNNAHIAPTDGWMGLGSCGTYGCLLETSQFNGSCTNYGPTEPAPSGWTWISAPQYFDFYCGPAIQRSMAFREAPIEVAPDSGQTTTQPPVPWPTTSDPGTNGEPANTTRDRLRGELENAPDEYPTLRGWLCAHLGGDCEDPTGQLLKLPTCLGVTFKACESALRDTGLQGTVTKRTLSQDDAIMEEDAGRTTGIYPGGGVRYDADVTVYVNPDPMPTMTAIETTVADQILQKNPGVDPDPESGRPRVAAETIARRCVKAVGKAGIPALTALDCGSLPIFITGYDAAGPAENDIQAIALTPKWVLLNRRVAPPRPSGSTNQWYYDQPGCLQTQKPTYSDAQCDEYPFWPTLRGHGGAFNDGITPYISWTKGAENGRQGNRLGHFFSANNPGPTLSWPGCSITPIPDQSAAPISALLGRELLPAPVLTASAAFLNVPVGKVGGRIKTIGLCNRTS